MNGKFLFNRTTANAPPFSGGWNYTNKTTRRGYAHKMNDFQTWLILQGYYRKPDGWGAWHKDGQPITGKELSDKLTEWKRLNRHT